MYADKQSIGFDWGSYDRNRASRLTLAAEIDQLGNKFKELEKQFVHLLDPRKYTILRVDGHCFSTFTRPFKKPWDTDLSDAMFHACHEWMKEFGGVCIYTQSDEATMVISKIPEESKSELPFSGRAEKIATLSASLFAVHFGEYLRSIGVDVKKPATFDARVFQVETDDDVYEVIRWRQLDGFRNGVSALARSIYSSKELHGVSVAQMLQMIDTDTLSKYKNNHLIHGTFVKKILVNKDLPDGTKITRTEIIHNAIGNSMHVTGIKKEDILSKYLGMKIEEIKHGEDEPVNISVESELNNLLKSINADRKTEGLSTVEITPKEAFDSLKSSIDDATKKENETQPTQPMPVACNAAPPVKKQSSQDDQRKREWFLDQ
jgi:tRNA(His) 5'-end guanylyltransferase